MIEAVATHVRGHGEQLDLRDPEPTQRLQGWASLCRTRDLGEAQE
jgi:hypothetical protein